MAPDDLTQRKRVQMDCPDGMDAAVEPNHPFGEYAYKTLKYRK